MREDNITKIFSTIEKVGHIKLYIEDIRDTSVKVEKFEKYFNNMSIEKFYSNIYMEFENLISIQLEKNYDVQLLEKFIERAKTILNHEILKYKFNLNSESLVREKFSKISLQKYYLFRKIQTHQTLNMNKIIKLLEHEIEFFKYKNLTINSSDTKDTPSTLEKSTSYEKKVMKDSTNLINRVTLNLSKTDSVMLFHMLEVCELIKFENNAHKISFIEQNFNYTELRKNKDYMKAIAIDGIQVEISNLKNQQKHSIKRFNKNLESLREKLETIMDFKLES